MAQSRRRGTSDRFFLLPRSKPGPAGLFFTLAGRPKIRLMPLKMPLKLNLRRSNSKLGVFFEMFQQSVVQRLVNGTHCIQGSSDEVRIDLSPDMIDT